MSQFIRETPYVVLKAKDLQAAGLSDVEFDALSAVCAKVDQHRRDAGKLDLECVVVEKDWPEYEPTWQAIERRVLAASRAGNCFERFGAFLAHISSRKATGCKTGAPALDAGLVDELVDSDDGAGRERMRS